MTKKQRNLSETQKNLIAAGIAGATSAAVVAPLDALTIASAADIFPKDLNTFQRVQSLAKNPTLLRKIYTQQVPLKWTKIIPAQMATFATYELAKKKLDQKFPTQVKQASEEKLAFVSLLKPIASLGGKALKGFTSLDKGNFGRNFLRGTGLSSAPVKAVPNKAGEMVKPLVTAGGVTGFAATMGVGGALNQAAAPVKSTSFSQLPKLHRL